MATVPIDDALLGDLLDDVRRRGLSDEPGEAVNDLIGSVLRRAAAPGYEGCGLTGCKTGWSLTKDLSRDVRGDGWADRTRYEESFLCLDIDDFKRFVDHEGFGRSDEVLASIGRQLLERFGEADTYRYGGDEFVVRLSGRQAWLPQVPEAILLKWAVAEIDVQRHPHRDHHLRSWIELHLAGAILSACPDGGRILVLTPSWMARG